MKNMNIGLGHDIGNDRSQGFSKIICIKNIYIFIIFMKHKNSMQKHLELSRTLEVKNTDKLARIVAAVFSPLPISLG